VLPFVITLLVKVRRLSAQELVHEYREAVMNVVVW